MNKITKKILIGITAVTLISQCYIPTTYAFWEILGQTAGTAMKADKIREKYLKISNNPYLQNAYFNDLGDENNELSNSTDLRAVQLTDDVMKKLLKDGKYYIRNTSLPFRWRTVASKEFNAFCNLTDYIAINEGLIEKVDYNPDLVAAVLGHEMTHGLKQHTANKAYHNVLASGGISILGQTMLNNGWGFGTTIGVQGLKFLATKNIDVPAELQADSEGFYLLSSAGFNPGGTCSMLARMKYYTEHADQLQDFFNPKSHPDTQRRLDDAAKLLYTYGMEHAKVKNIDSVYFDDKFLLRAEEESGLDQEEMAYMIVGGIAKAFHDYDTVDGWNFRKDDKGNIDYLDDSRIYGPLKRAIGRWHMEEEFLNKVTKAYLDDSISDKRIRCMMNEKNYYADLEKRKTKELEENFMSDEKVASGNAYIKLKLTDYAEKEYVRAERLNKHNPSARSGMALVESQRGNYEQALLLADEAIKMDSTIGSCYTAKAIVCHAMGDIGGALELCKIANSVEKKDGYAYKIAGDIYDELSNHGNALAEYKAYKEATKDILKKNKLTVPADIPEAYRDEL